MTGQEAAQHCGKCLRTETGQRAQRSIDGLSGHPGAEREQ
jgi:hypothetical protein